MFLRLGIPHRATALVTAVVLLGFTIGTSQAKPRKPRFGWQGFTGTVRGGYNIGGPVGAAAGPATIRFRAAKNGRSARVTWRNTFYTSAGSYIVAMQWNFAADGSVSVSTFDPRVRGFSGTGTFELSGNRPIQFTVKDAAGTVTGTGQFRLIGGGAVSATLTLTGTSEGEVSCGFTGGRVR